VHPNHPEKAALTSRPKLGEGVVIKFGSGYATSGTSAALLRQLLQGMPLQTYFNHGDIPGGRTLGQLALTQVPLNTVDIGLAQLAMHSACETAGTADTAYLIEAMERFFAARIRETAPGTFQVEH
jgi:aspartyl aminopeptidase